jgi:hypothetical protein
MRLGELLVKEGKITSFELEETLKGQAIFGGRFGTNLVEMGYLEESDLAHFLSKKTGMPHASSEQLMNIPPQVIRLLPGEAVKKYRVVPLALNNRKLSLAMTDPSDLATIDEISFVTGYIVVPLVTPELRLICALEKYYNVRREQRYIPVAGGGRGRARALQPPPPPPVQQAPPPPPPASRPAESEIFDLPPLDESDFFGDLNEVAVPQPAPASLAKAVLPTAAATVDFSLEGVLRGLVEAPDRHGVADLIVGYTARQFGRSALFLIKGNQATGWVARIGTEPLPGFPTLQIGLDEPSVLRGVAVSKDHYLGPVPITPCNSRIFAALGAPPLSNQFLAPLTMMGRVVAILYVDGCTQKLEERIPELQKLLAKGSMAFEILILKSKILLT